ncbi:MAG: amidase [Alphaproteobacteria bacterium]
MNSMMDPFESATSLAAKLRSGDITAREAVDAAIARIEAIDPLINAVVVRNFEAAREAANEADRARENGEIMGRLHGVPMTIKEAFDLAGLSTTWGVPNLRNNVAPRDSLIAEKLKAAGAIILGKTNVPPMLSDWQTFNDIYGTTNNPWDVTRSPGGSSGGAAAALAAGMTPLEVGSDIGASIRSPSHFCGVYGHKASFGVVPTDGHTVPGLEVELDLLVAGPMARTSADLRLGLELLAGPSREESAAWRLDLPVEAHDKLSDFRVAVCLDESVCRVDEQVKAAVHRVADYCVSQGAAVSHTARPEFDFAQAQDRYLTILRGATGALMNDEEFASAREVAAKLAPDDRSYWAYLNRAAVQGHRHFFTAEQDRRRIRDAWAAFFQEWDIFLCPIAASTAIQHDQDRPRHERTITVNGRQESYNDQLFWAGMATLPYLPSTVFPAGPSDNGLPVGVQAIGPYLQDLRTIRFAELLEDGLCGFSAPPGY